MFINESRWIKNVLATDVDLDAVDSVLDVGSSTLEFRTSVQPYIEENVFKPLRLKGKRIYHLDKKKDIGVDIVCDIDQIQYIEKKFDLIICTSLLEHVPDPTKVANDIVSLLDNDGYLLVTVPHNYIYHEDPIDTMFRPDNKTLELLFQELSVIRSEVITIDKIHFKKRLDNLIFILLNKRNLLGDFSGYATCLYKKFSIACILLRNLSNAGDFVCQE